jgi:threonylcarbamoyladenosine tRNA methylthiotransferase MtaB
VRVYFTNLGCKLNQAEMEALARRFVGAGHQIAPRIEEADLHVVNTCTVTHVAARDSRKLARRGRRINPALKTVLTGCYVSAEPQAAAALAGVDLIVANPEKAELLQHVHDAFPQLRPLRSGIPEMPSAPLEFGHARAAVKIEDGCNMRCSFCIIPFTRGRQESRRPESIVSEVAALAEGGFGEIVLTGVQISSYHSGSWRLFDLVQAILRETRTARLRLTSIAPWDFDLRLLDLVAEGRVCRHFHLSLQSGSLSTLRRMRRPYTPGQFSRLLERIRDRTPGVALTTDVIVGFPGETDTEFDESIEFVEACAFSRVHAFPYSERPGTAAAGFPGAVEVTVRRGRMERMLSLARRLERAFRTAQLGTVGEALWESEHDGEWRGTTDNYLRVRMPRRGSPSQSLEQVRLIADGAHGIEVESLAEGRNEAMTA